MEVLFKVLIIVIMVLFAVSLAMDIYRGYKSCEVGDRLDTVEGDIRYLDDLLDEADFDCLPTIKESIEKIQEERKHMITALKGLHESIRIIAEKQGVIIEPIPPTEPAMKGTADGYPSN